MDEGEVKFGSLTTNPGVGQDPVLLRKSASPQCSFDLIGWLSEYLPHDKLTDARGDGDEMVGVEKPSAKKPLTVAPGYETKRKQWANDFMAPYDTPLASKLTISISHLSEYMKTYVSLLGAEQLFEIISKNTIEMIPEFGIVDLRDTYDKKKINTAINMPFEDKSIVAVLKESTDSDADERVWTQLAAVEGSPLNTIAKKRIVVVHCASSANRTPMFVNGYIKYIGQPNYQRVFILKNGFSAFENYVKKIKNTNMADKIIVDRSPEEQVSLASLMVRNMTLIDEFHQTRKSQVPVSKAIA